jgi:hypothetical protein
VLGRPSPALAVHPRSKSKQHPIAARSARTKAASADATRAPTKRGQTTNKLEDLHQFTAPEHWYRHALNRAITITDSQNLRIADQASP